MKPTLVSPRGPAHPHLHRLLVGVALLTAVVIALVLGFVDTAGAAPRAGRGGYGAHGMLQGLGMGILDAAEKLKLSDEQVERLKAIRKSAPGQIMPKTQALMEARIELRDLMAEENAKGDALRRAHQNVLQARAAVQSASFDLRLQVREVLTPKQRAELKELLRARAQERRPRAPMSPRMRAPHGGWDDGGLDDDADLGF